MYIYICIYINKQHEECFIFLKDETEAVKALADVSFANDDGMEQAPFEYENNCSYQ